MTEETIPAEAVLEYARSMILDLVQMLRSAGLDVAVDRLDEVEL